MMVDSCVLILSLNNQDVINTNKFHFVMCCKTVVQLTNEKRFNVMHIYEF